MLDNLQSWNDTPDAFSYQGRIDPTKKFAVIRECLTNAEFQKLLRRAQADDKRAASETRGNSGEVTYDDNEEVMVAELLSTNNEKCMEKLQQCFGSSSPGQALGDLLGYVDLLEQAE